MRRRSEGPARYIDQESRSGPNPESRHAGQDRMKRVRKHKTFNFLRVSTNFNWYVRPIAAFLVGNFEQTALNFYARRAASAREHT
jgi:hypothetical protein